jgi:uncharacterized membrane protein
VRSLIRSPRDFWLGVIYATVGGAGFLIARDYSFGSGARMGPGYFPTIVSALLIVFGILGIGRSCILSGEAVGEIAWKALPLVIGSSVVFGVLLDQAGFVAAALALLFMSAAASSKFKFRWTTIAGAVALVSVCTLLFVKGLGIPMLAVGPLLQPLAPTWLGG